MCAAVDDKLVLVGGEREPSARGHAGAGNFSDQVTVLGVTEDSIRVEKEFQGPPARGWSAGDVWKTDTGDRLVVVGGLTGDDTSPQRLMDVWELMCTCSFGVFCFLVTI